MKLVFFGTPEFALPSLEILHKSQHQVAGVVTAADKPRGRGMNPTPTPVAEKAADLHLPILKPADLRDPDFLTQLKCWEADVFVVVAFRILPEEVFTMPPDGAINLHASLLPAYRGAAPIQWALWNGERETGVTTFRIEKTVDTGNILMQRKVEILDTDDAGMLSERLSHLGADLLLDTITDLERGQIIPVRQNSAFASPAPKITKEHCRIDWNRPAIELHNQVRALAPEPGAVAQFGEQTVKIFCTTVDTQHCLMKPGELQIGNQEIVAGTGSGCLQIIELQLQGKKRMDVNAFLRGFRPRGVFRLIDERR